MEFIESERGNQKLNIKLKKKLWGGNYPRGAIVLGGQLSCSPDNYGCIIHVYKL